MKRSWSKKSYRFLVILIPFFAILLFGIFLKFFRENSVLTKVKYYQGFQIDVNSGKLNLKKSSGNAPPRVGGFVSCSYSLSSGFHLIPPQPQLCSSLDHDLNLNMHFEEQQDQRGTLRVIQIRQKHLPPQTLLNEPIDRGMLRLTYLKKSGWLGIRYQLIEIYEIFEKEMDEKFRAVESFTRDGNGSLLEITESSALNFTSEDLYAVYNGKGELIKIPHGLNKSFIFPAKLDVSKIKNLDLSKKIESGI